MGNEIAYHDISCAHQIQHFLKQGGAVLLSPCNLRQGASSLDPCEHLAHRVSFPQFKIEWRLCVSGTQRGRGCGVGAAALLQFFDDSRGKWARKWAEPLGGIYNWSRWKHGISGGNGTNWELITKLCEFYPCRKQVFLEF